jgi:hypothetical protein
MIAVSEGTPTPAAQSSDESRGLLRLLGSAGQRGTALALAVCAATALPLAACGAGHPAASPVVTRTCQQVSAVLADGPDSATDEVGYAEAQILPLRELHTSDPVLRTAIGRLASAYDRFFAAGGKSAAATTAVAGATASMNRLCPGAAA